MGCKNCRDFNANSCTDVVPSNCIPWQGDAIEELDICLNDSLTYIGNIVLDKIKNLLKGKGIILEDLNLDDCEYISELLGTQEKNLLNVLKVYKEAICQIKEQEELNTLDIQAFADVSLYTLGCLTITGDICDTCNGDASAFKNLIQTIINKLCALDAQFQSIGETILDAIEDGVGNFLVGGAITSCGGNGYSTSGIGATAKVTFEALVPPRCPILYTGSTSFFDSAGVGLPNTAYCGWFLCNGSNGTPNSTTLPQNSANNLQYIIRFD